jgi:choline monooxygenase
MPDIDPNGGEILDQFSDWAQKPFDQSGTIPSLVYTSNEILQLEIEHLFKRQWICVGRVDQVAKPGGYFSFDIAECPIIVVRDDAEEIKALSNVCRHRGTELVSGSGSCRGFTCPYHAWTYNFDGALRAAPFMDRTANFDPASLTLPQYRVELWHGFIYVNLDRQAAPFAPDVAGLDALFKEHEVADMRSAFNGTLDVACNWKVQVENFCESYHVFKVHPQTIEPMMTTASVQVQPGGAGFNHHTQRPPEGFVDPQPDAHAYLSAEQRNTFNLICAYPAQAIALGSGAIAWLSVLPNGVDRCTVNYASAMRPETTGGEINAEQAEQAEQFMLEFMREDLVIIETLQKGFAVNPGGAPYCEMEKSNWEFGRYIVQQVCAAPRSG